MTPIGINWKAVWQDGVWDPVWALTRPAWVRFSDATLSIPGALRATLSTAGLEDAELSGPGGRTAALITSS